MADIKIMHTQTNARIKALSGGSFKMLLTDDVGTETLLYLNQECAYKLHGDLDELVASRYLRGK